MDWNRIPIASYIFFGLFLLTSVVHLVFCFFEMELPRKITKCFTTGFLSIACIIAIPTEPLVYLGCVFSMLGDLFLLKKHKVWPFVGGMVSFLVAHICYIAAFIALCQPLHYGYYVFLAVYMVVFPVLFFQVAKRIVHQKKIVFGGTMYFAVLTMDLIWAIIACCKGHLDYCLLCAFGAASFLVSDIFLTKTMFQRDVKRRDFYIMATYLLAQGLIIAGFTMTLLMR